METLKINYDDFYKFKVSASILLFILSIIAASWMIIKFSDKVKDIASLFNIVTALYLVLSFCCVCWIYDAVKKWEANQKIIDEKLREELRIMKSTSQEKTFVTPKFNSLKEKTTSKKKQHDDTALVDYKIASVLPGTVTYDLIDSGKVWFWMTNKEGRKYISYVEVEFISEGYNEKIEESYYGGKKGWNLNAFTGIHAPGMPIPPRIIELAKEGKRVEIKINCTIYDEKKKLVEKKLPVSYVYDKKNKSWYFEP